MKIITKHTKRYMKNKKANDTCEKPRLFLINAENDMDIQMTLSTITETESGSILRMNDEILIYVQNENFNLDIFLSTIEAKKLYNALNVLINDAKIIE